MTQGISILRDSRSVRRRTKCAPLGATKFLVPPCGEAELNRLMAAHLRRLGRTPWFVRQQACLHCHTQQLADGLARAYRSRVAVSGPDGLHTVTAPAHLPRFLDAELREIWLVQLWHAFDEARFPQVHRADFWAWAEALSLRLMPVDAGMRVPNRYPYAAVQAWFADDTDVN